MEAIQQQNVQHTSLMHCTLLSADNVVLAVRKLPQREHKEHSHSDHVAANCKALSIYAAICTACCCCCCAGTASLRGPTAVRYCSPYSTCDSSAPTDS